MKKSYLVLIVAILMFSCSSDPHYKITGKIDGADSITFLLQKRVDGRLVTIDSAFSKKGAFRMKGGPVRFPEMVMLAAKDSRMRTTFYLENSDIEITGKLDSLFNARITGSKTHDEYKGFVESNKALSDRYTKTYNDYQTAYQENDTARVNALEKEIISIQESMINLQKDFVKKNPSSFVSPSILLGLSSEMEASELESLVNAFDTALKNTPAVKELTELIAKMKPVSVGQKAPDFTMNDPKGNPVSLSSKVGPKLLLVDFWAGWCGPCRRENPNIVKLYKDFHSKGFDIFGVSLDRNKEEWLNAIEDDKLTWTHVSDLQYWNNAAARLYVVNSIPANFLLDANGVIIARNVLGNDLYNKVKEILSNQ
ncbi:MAG: redoxin domain-containing protein [Bacteroidales bacterium]|nr:redoxin domain-containing protein [Bacteroidales bacterium]